MKRWVFSRSNGRLMLSRPGRHAMDVAVSTGFPNLRPEVLAHEIRKDLWRQLKHLRGFSPVVVVEASAEGLRLTAGGSVASRTWPKEKTLTEIEALLSNPAKRSRWIAHARQR